MGNRYIDNTSYASQKVCDTTSSWFGHSAFTFILPFMEGNAQYNSVNYSLVANSSRNTTTYFTKLSSYICPSDMTAPPYSTPWAQCSYGMSRGTQENIYENWASTAFPDPSGQQPGKCNAALGNGMFGAEDVVRISAVTDGTSNTTLFGETSRGKNDPSKGINWYHFTAAFGTTNIGGYGFSGEVRIETGAFTYPDINGPFDTTGQYMNAVFCGLRYRCLHPVGLARSQVHPKREEAGAIRIPELPPRRRQFRFRRWLGEVRQADDQHIFAHGDLVLALAARSSVPTRIELREW